MPSAGGDEIGPLCCLQLPLSALEEYAGKGEGDVGRLLAPSTAVSYVALQDHRCVTADGLHAILFSLEGSV